MKKQYDFSKGERGKFFRKAALLVPQQTAEANVVIDREGYPIVLLPEEIRIDATEMRVSRYGTRVILTPIKKKKRAPEN
jgi:hypothetical protein